MLEQPKGTFFIILILGALTTITPFSIDMYLPAFPKIGEQFGVTTAQVALTLSVYFIGLAIGQIFYGPLLDRFGRKPPLYMGLLFYILASVACAFAPSIEVLIAARFFQALGGCVASVASVAMVRDFFSPKDGAKVFSRLMLILSVSPLFAPTVGSWIVSQWSWQTVFLVLAVITSLFLAIVFFFLPEGHQPDPSVSLKITSIVKTFSSIMTNPQFFVFTLSGAFSFAGLFTYLAGSPAIFLGMFHVSEKVFGLIFAGLSVGMIGGGQVNILLMKKFTGRQIYQIALRLQLLVGLFFLVGCLMDLYGLYAHIALLFVYMSCSGLIYPNAAALSLEPFHKNSGSASALMGTIQMGIGSLAAALFGFLKFSPNIAVAFVFVVTSLIGNGIYYFCHRKNALGSLGLSEK